MKVFHDKDKDTAYVAMGDKRPKDVPFQTFGNGTLPEPWQNDDKPLTFKLDWDEQGRLLGMELAPASSILTPHALKDAQ